MIGRRRHLAHPMHNFLRERLDIFFSFRYDLPESKALTCPSRKINTETYRPDFDQLSQSLDKASSRESAIWNDVYQVLSAIDCDADSIENAIDTAFGVIDGPSGEFAKEFTIELPTLPWTR